MKLNVSKFKFMLFNHKTNLEFSPEFSTEGNQIETLEEIKLLGIVIFNDLKWKSNTESITKKAFSRL